MAVREIKLMGDKNLRRKAQNVPPDKIKSKEVQLLIDDLLETASQTPEDGFITAGLAAPQVNESVRIFLVMKEGSNRKKPDYVVYVNPQLEFTDQKMVESEESCLSTPGICGTVRRYDSLRVTYLDRDGNKQRKKFAGEQAIFIQHENDHLDGILWIDKVIDTKTISYC